MATINEVLERAARIRPDAFDDDTKARWILALEGQIFREVILRHRLTEGREPQRPQTAYCPDCGCTVRYIWQLDLCACERCGWAELPEYPRRFPEDGDMPLLVPDPYDRLYALYLFAQIDQADREIDNYNNSAQLFNEAYGDWRREYHRTHMPLPAGGFRDEWGWLR